MSLISDPERQTAWQHWRWPLSDVHQKKGPPHWSGHGGAHLSPEGNTDGTTPYRRFNIQPSCSQSSVLCPLSLQVKSQDIFDAWVSKLRHHRLYRQNEIVRSPREATMRTFPPSAAVESPQPATNVVHEAKVCSPSSFLPRLPKTLDHTVLLIRA